MKVTTTRFGQIEINNNEIITLPEGLLGFDQLRKFCVIDPGDNTLILWLQSTEDESIAFPIIEPKIFKPDYVVKLTPNDLRNLEMENLDNARIYSILTIPNTITDMSANLKAPLIINASTRQARQVVLQDNKLTVNHLMYNDLKKYIVAYASDDSTRTTTREPQAVDQASEGAEQSTNIKRAPEAEA